MNIKNSTRVIKGLIIITVIFLVGVSFILIKNTSQFSEGGVQETVKLENTHNTPSHISLTSEGVLEIFQNGERRIIPIPPMVAFPPTEVSQEILDINPELANELNEMRKKFGKIEDFLLVGDSIIYLRGTYCVNTGTHCELGVYNITTSENRIILRDGELKNPALFLNWHLSLLSYDNSTEVVRILLTTTEIEQTSQYTQRVTKSFSLYEVDLKTNKASKVESAIKVMCNDGMQEYECKAEDTISNRYYESRLKEILSSRK